MPYVLRGRRERKSSLVHWVWSRKIFGQAAIRTCNRLAEGTIMEWFTAPELADFSLVGMPNTRQGMLSILKKLVKPCHDKSRQREGSKATEYHISILPPAVQAALLRKAGKVVVGGMTLDLPKDEPQVRYCKEAVWDRWTGRIPRRKRRPRPRWPPCRP